VERSNIQVDLDLPEELGRLPQDLETTVFRIVQEALTNVHRHSGSSIAKVQLTIAPGGIHLVIQDQGKGISLDKVEGTPNGTKIGVGIRGMRERVRQFGGELRIGPANPGTCVEAILPVSFSSHA
jgi:signal transduction histidine kinase